MLQTVADVEGRFALQNVPIGIYEVTTEKSGFASVRQREVKVNLGSVIVVYPMHRVGAITETMGVAESDVMLETVSSRTVEGKFCFSTRVRH